MKRTLLFLLAVSSLTVFGGCSEMSPDDREFYGRGWIHPGDLDRERPTQLSAHPETTGSLGAGPIPETSARGAERGAPDRY